MGHDQRFKEFLQTFLQDFLRLFFPEVERRLDFRSVEFLDKEVFTDLGEGSSRQADVVAKLATLDGHAELLLVHCEVQAKPERDFGARMLEYYSLLRARYRIPIFPVAVYLRGGSAGVSSEKHRVELFGQEILRFRYRSVALARLDAEEYRNGVGPVGAALAALMDTSKVPERAELRASLLLEIVESGLDDARQLLLGNLVTTYLELTEDERRRYRSLVSRKEYRKMQDVEETWLDKALRQGEEKGQKEGLRSGIVLGKREALLAQLVAKFGPLPQELDSRIRAMSEDVLDQWLGRILTANRLEEMEFDS